MAIVATLALGACALTEPAQPPVAGDLPAAVPTALVRCGQDVSDDPPDAMRNAEAAGDGALQGSAGFAMDVLLVDPVARGHTAEEQYRAASIQHDLCYSHGFLTSGRTIAQCDQLFVRHIQRTNMQISPPGETLAEPGGWRTPLIRLAVGQYGPYSRVGRTACDYDWSTRRNGAMAPAGRPVLVRIPATRRGHAVAVELADVGGALSMRRFDIAPDGTVTRLARQQLPALDAVPVRGLDGQFLGSLKALRPDDPLEDFVAWYESQVPTAPRRPGSDTVPPPVFSVRISAAEILAHEPVVVRTRGAAWHVAIPVPVEQHGLVLVLLDIERGVLSAERVAPLDVFAPDLLRRPQHGAGRPVDAADEAAELARGEPSSCGCAGTQVEAERCGTLAQTLGISGVAHLAPGPRADNPPPGFARDRRASQRIAGVNDQDGACAYARSIRTRLAERRLLDMLRQPVHAGALLRGEDRDSIVLAAHPAFASRLLPPAAGAPLGAQPDYDPTAASLEEVAVVARALELVTIRPSAEPGRLFAKAGRREVVDDLWRPARINANEPSIRIAPRQHSAIASATAALRRLLVETDLYKRFAYRPALQPADSTQNATLTLNFRDKAEAGLCDYFAGRHQAFLPPHERYEERVGYLPGLPRSPERCFTRRNVLTQIMLKADMGRAGRFWSHPANPATFADAVSDWRDGGSGLNEPEALEPGIALHAAARRVIPWQRAAYPIAFDPAGRMASLFLAGTADAPGLQLRRTSDTGFANLVDRMSEGLPPLISIGTAQPAAMAGPPNGGMGGCGDKPNLRDYMRPAGVVIFDESGPGFMLFAERVLAGNMTPCPPPAVLEMLRVHGDGRAEHISCPNPDASNPAGVRPSRLIPMTVLHEPDPVVLLPHRRAGQELRLYTLARRDGHWQLDGKPCAARAAVAHPTPP